MTTTVEVLAAASEAAREAGESARWNGILRGPPVGWPNGRIIAIAKNIS